MTDTTKKTSEIPPEQLSLKSRFRFECHKGVKCFTDCCRGIDIMLTPYDILTMRKKLDMTSEKFLAIFTDPQILEKADLPVVTLKLLDDERQSCPFVEDKEGCVIYKDRPTTCRYYPLGVGSLSYSGEQGEKEEFFFTVKEDHCLGFEEKKDWTVAEWREDQGINLRDEVNEGWLDLMVRKKSLPPSMKLTEESKKIFFMVCYNIDKFKEFVFNSSFLDRYDLPEEKIQEIKEDDVKLLQFGFDWLKASFFHTGQEKFKIKKKD
ncbi:MAG: YkgJ family cysteine cluster protein [Proteobacteria bacterium]|nr:YkgJ family cysteine cluster protein [Pseudomonadota bacterium]MBU1386367.1 YkgJ family cysteine cluster protein [Pseudomonadota bacterium]MBU1544478.1 YkgJ family cysteine cluster protein [Pseudomonadota bacterium]MBU2480343.1 YkgJ family cysteine cluster protein [Pseudomonadota bacterium]